jgi:hypothetical protein
MNQRDLFAELSRTDIYIVATACAVVVRIGITICKKKLVE